MMRRPSQPTRGERCPQNSRKRKVGTLFLVGVPLGHPDDLSSRAIRTLKRVAVVAAETPILTQALLARYHIRTTITSYGSQGLEEKIAVLIQRLTEGRDVALVTDAGMPGVYDPGALLVTAAHKSGVSVSVIPGPSAVTAAVACSGYSGNSFIFEGRTPASPRALLQLFEGFKEERRTGVFYVERQFLPRVLKILARSLPNRPVTLCVNLTLRGETIMQGRPANLLTCLAALQRDGKITLVLRGKEN